MRHWTWRRDTGVGRGGDGDTPTPGQQMFTECAGWSWSSPRTLLKAASCSGSQGWLVSLRGVIIWCQTVRTSGESSHGPLQTYVALDSGVTDGSFALWVLAPGLPAKSRTSKSSRPQCSWPSGLQACSSLWVGAGRALQWLRIGPVLTPPILMDNSLPSWIWF